VSVARAALPALAVLMLLLPGTAAASGLAAMSDPAWSAVPDLTVPDAPRRAAPRLRLAQADTDSGEALGSDVLDLHAGPDDEQPWHEPWITGNKLHKYLGIGSLVAAGLAAVTPPESEGDGGGGGRNGGKGFHHYAGWTAAGLAGAAVGTGLVFHLDDIHLQNGLTDPDNLHALLGVLAATAYFAAVSTAPDSSHGGMGVAGAAAMLVSIKLAW
jgi:hypothetical protein